MKPLALATMGYDNNIEIACVKDLKSEKAYKIKLDNSPDEDVEGCSNVS